MNSNATTAVRFPANDGRTVASAACLLGAAAAALSVMPGLAWADRYERHERYGNRHIDRARVVEARPVLQRVVEPRRECTSQVVHEPVQGGYRAHRPDDLVGPVIGGVAGGVIGSQIGGGSGRTAATVAGAVAGTIAGSVLLPPHHGHARAPQVVERVVERCRTVNHARDVVQGYDVTYRHQGRLFTTRMPYDPGRFVQVDVRRAGPDRGQWRGYAEPAVVVVERSDRGGRPRRSDDDD